MIDNFKLLIIILHIVHMSKLTYEEKYNIRNDA